MLIFSIRQSYLNSSPEISIYFQELLERSHWFFVCLHLVDLIIYVAITSFFPPQGIKLSADVKPFVPKYAGLSVAWLESSEAPVFPSCAAAYYPCVQELPVPEYVFLQTLRLT